MASPGTLGGPQRGMHGSTRAHRCTDTHSPAEAPQEHRDRAFFLFQRRATKGSKERVSALTQSRVARCSWPDARASTIKSSLKSGQKMKTDTSAKKIHGRQWSPGEEVISARPYGNVQLKTTTRRENLTPPSAGEDVGQQEPCS